MSQFSNRFEHIWSLLQTEYGSDEDVSIYKRTSSGVDLKTGIPNQTLDVTTFCDVIVLPANVFAKFVQNVPKTAPDRPFIYGGTWPTSSRAFLIDPDDGADLNLTEEDWIVYRGRKYEILKFTEFEVDEAWIIFADAVHGDVGCQVFEVCAEDTLPIGDNNAASSTI